MNRPIVSICTIITLATSQQAISAEGLEEIVVTAQRRSQSIMDVPISITAFTESAIQDSMIDGVEDYFAKTPNISISTGATRSGNVSDSSHGLALRGISNIGGNVSSFGYYLDDFNISQATVNPHLVDVERIEVLRGPQGTFFGRNASAGVISVTTNKPSDEFAGSIILDFSEFDTIQATGMINVPISDKFLLRANIKKATSDGYAQNKHSVGGSNGYEYDFARVSARILPSDNLTIDLNAMYTDEHTDDLGLISTGVQRASISSFLCSVLVGTNSVSACPFDTASGLYPQNTTDYYHNNPLQVDDKYKAFNTKVVWEGEDLTVTGIAGYINTDFYRSGELDFSSLDQINEDFQYREEESKSMELRVQSNNSGNFNWILGGLWGEDTTTGKENINFGTHAPTNSFFGVFPHFRIEESTQDNTISSVALFAEGTWDLSEKLQVIMGARWSEDEIELNESLIDFESPVRSGGAKQKYSDVSPRLAIHYGLSDTTNFYATVAKGWKAGGFNLELTSTSNPVRTFDEETLWNYEIGMKTEMLDRNLRLNVALFHIDWDDIQVRNSRLVRNDDNTLASISGINNGAKASSQGVEIEVAYLPTESLELGFNLGYLDAEFDSYPGAITDFNNTSNPVDLSGQPLPKAPEITFSASAEYRFEMANNWQSFTRAEFSYVDESYFDINSIHGALLGKSYPFTTPSRSTWNFRVGADNGKYRIAAYVENAFDEQYYTSNYDFGFLNGTGVVPSYRYYGIQFKASFE